MKRQQRHSRGYSGTHVTTRHLDELLHSALVQVNEVYQGRPDLVLASWPTTIGPELAKMTEAISFYDGVLVVKVRNSTLYSLLSQRDKPRVLAALRQQVPSIPIRNIVFRMG